MVIDYFENHFCSQYDFTGGAVEIVAGIVAGIIDDNYKKRRLERRMWRGFYTATVHSQTFTSSLSVTNAYSDYIPPYRTVYAKATDVNNNIWTSPYEKIGSYSPRVYMNAWS